jgi:hypothetical protein
MGGRLSPLSTTCRAPHNRTQSSSLSEHTAVTSTPAEEASWTAKPPTAPLAPVTRSLALAGTSRRSNACAAVSPFSGMVAATTGSTPSGTGTAHSAGTAM